MTPDRAAERVEKLLRLASPSSGTTDAERTSAALEAAKLFAEHRLVVSTAAVKEASSFKARTRKREVAKPRSRPAPPRPRSQQPSEGPEWIDPNWHEVAIDAAYEICAVCDEHIYRGEDALFSFAFGYRHIVCPEP